MLDAEVIGTYHGHECRYTPTIMDGPVFRWSVGGQDIVSASRNGLMFHTPYTYSAGQLEKLLAVVELAKQVGDRLERLGFYQYADSIVEFVRNYKG